MRRAPLPALGIGEESIHIKVSKRPQDSYIVFRGTAEMKSRRFARNVSSCLICGEHKTVVFNTVA